MYLFGDGFWLFWFAAALTFGIESWVTWLQARDAAAKLPPTGSVS